jgi:hypothetical protein
MMAELLVEASEVAEQLNTATARERLAFWQQMVADLSPDSWLDLESVVDHEKTMRNDDGERLDG